MSAPASAVIAAICVPPSVSNVSVYVSFFLPQATKNAARTASKIAPIVVSNDLRNVFLISFFSFPFPGKVFVVPKPFASEQRNISGKLKYIQSQV